MNKSIQILEARDLDRMTTNIAKAMNETGVKRIIAIQLDRHL